MTAAMRIRQDCLPVLSFLLCLFAPWTAAAHSLGIDKAELIERTGGTYVLLSKVPARLASAITTPILPARCAIAGNPRGERGPYEVRFSFTCAAPLTADDMIRLPWRREGVLLTARWLEGPPVSRLTSREGAAITLHLADYRAGSGSVWRTVQRYTILGIEHILIGIDHLLFVLALLFVVQGGWRLVQTITAFTVAHSITLGLATLGYVKLPSAPVEAAIALSIVFLCAEILRARDGQKGLTFRAPWVVAFAFGLLHGLGFAGALSEIGLPPPEIPLALLFFNIGVELGQLAFVAAVLALWWLWQRSRLGWPGWLHPLPAYAIGTLATYWFLERGAGIFI